MTVLDVKTFVQTYSPPQSEYQDGGQLQLVEDFQRVQNYVAEHPDAGRTAVGTALDLPPARVRGWINGKRPDAIRGLHVAQDHGWVPLEYDDERFQGGLNVLVTWIFSSGSIAASNYAPSFSVSSAAERARLTDALDTAGVDYDIIREDEQRRATEVRVIKVATVLGRVLAALGAPVGTKNADADITLPNYLDGGPDAVREEFATTYLANRLTQTEGRTVAQFREARSPTYRRELQQFLDTVLDVEVSISGQNLYLSEWPPTVPREDDSENSSGNRKPVGR